MSSAATAPFKSPSGERLCDGSGELEVCLTRVPHTHCECGMPMQRGRRFCPYCINEKALSLARFVREVEDGVMSSRVTDSGGWDTGRRRRLQKGLS